MSCCITRTSLTYSISWWFCSSTCILFFFTSGITVAFPIIITPKWTFCCTWITCYTCIVWLWSWSPWISIPCRCICSNYPTWMIWCISTSCIYCLCSTCVSVSLIMFTITCPLTPSWTRTIRIFPLIWSICRWWICIISRNYSLSLWFIWSTTIYTCQIRTTFTT